MGVNVVECRVLFARVLVLPGLCFGSEGVGGASCRVLFARAPVLGLCFGSWGVGVNVLD